MLSELRRAPVTQALALALATIVGVVALSLGEHGAAVQHMRCAEHGELMHVPMAASSEGTVPGPTARSTIATSQSGTVDAHEHCDLSLSVQESVPAPPPLQAIRVASHPSLSPRRATQAPRLGRSYVLATAPKTSPPSV